MERVRITEACDALDRPYQPSGRKLCRFEPGTVLRLLRQDDREFYNVAYLGMALFVPKTCAIGATKDEPLIEILGTTEAVEEPAATSPSSADVSLPTVESETPTDAASSVAPVSAPPPPEAPAGEAPSRAARPASQAAAFVVPRWLRWFASQRLALQRQRAVDAETPTDASSEAPVSSTPMPTSAPEPAREALATALPRTIVADASDPSSDLHALVQRLYQANVAAMAQLAMIGMRAGDALPPLPKRVDDMNDTERQIYEVVAAAAESLEFINERVLVARRLLELQDEVERQ